jgi:hypothetical protein
MLKPMVKQTLVKLIKKKIEDNPEDGMRYYLKLYGLIVFLDMVLLKLLPLSLCMVKRPFCPLR